jgi:hypothetical protein
MSLFEDSIKAKELDIDNDKLISTYHDVFKSLQPVPSIYCTPKEGIHHLELKFNEAYQPKLSKDLNMTPFLTRITIDDAGYVVENFSDGSRKKLFQTLESNAKENDIIIEDLSSHDEYVGNKVSDEFILLEQEIDEKFNINDFNSILTSVTEINDHTRKYLEHYNQDDKPEDHPYNKHNMPWTSLFGTQAIKFQNLGKIFCHLDANDYVNDIDSFPHFYNNTLEIGKLDESVTTFDNAISAFNFLNAACDYEYINPLPTGLAQDLAALQHEFLASFKLI